VKVLLKLVADLLEYFIHSLVKACQQLESKILWNLVLNLNPKLQNLETKICSMLDPATSDHNLSLKDITLITSIFFRLAALVLGMKC